MADFTQNIYYTYAYEIAQGKMGNQYIYSIQEGKIYEYNEGVWKNIFEEEIFNKIHKYNIKTTALNSSQLSQIIEQFKIIKHARLDIFNQMPLINFDNYMFDPLGNNVLSHSPEYYSTIRIPYKYDALVKCELWIKTLFEIFEGNTQKIELLQEFFGYCLSGDNEQKKGLLLLGETDTGKSTIIDTFREVIGEDNISNVPLEYLAHPQYTPLLMNKSVNLDPDVNKNAADYEREFKIITGGKREKVSCNQKHIPTFEFTPRCKLILAANIFPKITDHSSAFYQRLIVIPCERRFQENEKDRLLNDKLKIELPGIFNWMIAGLNRLKKRGSFEQHDFMIKAVEELENENNPSNLFFEEHIEISIGSYIEKGELFERYIEWAGKDKQYILSKSRFSTAVFKKFGKYTPKTTMHQETHKRIWRNIKYVHFKDNIKQEISWEPAAISNTSDAKAVNAVQTGTGTRENIDWET